MKAITYTRKRALRGRVMRSVLTLFRDRAHLTTREAYDLLGDAHEECSIYRALRVLHLHNVISRGPKEKGGPRKCVIWLANECTRTWIKRTWPNQPLRGTRAKRIPQQICS